ncbi:SGNH/GDSL hydrolase family protein [Lignipirellula cremea]|uniref:Arylesterase n=1 Tax=Lignipirellula cremea TaxID=2528010 RepID=A0A518DL88_9BACT|nr:SGNH/GDSL hydrolase family protein [Lignipirellula cremea]QDU92591.1 Arylesterase precursor [Lignipirellula cremea]
MVRNLLLMTLVLGCCLPLHAADPALTVKKGDLWVMAGDSITAQRQHSNYIEAFYRTRYPELGLQFRNSGIGGNRTSSILARFDYDVAAWKPTIVSIELGMNDVGSGDDPAKYIDGMRQLIQKIRDIGAQPVLISSSPVNDGSVTGDWKSDRCRRIDPYTVALKKLAEEEQVVVIDQYHALLDLWGKNHRSETPINLTGDAVHPGPVGQYTMAGVILSQLQAKRDVSSATLSADGKVGAAEGCKISDVSAADGKLAFTRIDEASAWPISPKSQAAADLLPEIHDLSRWMLTVTDLPAGEYQVTINGKPAAVLTEKELASGWNMATVFEGAIADRSNKIVGLISGLQGGLNNNWRLASKEQDAEKLATAQQAIEAQESLLQAACAPEAWRIEIEKK